MNNILLENLEKKKEKKTCDLFYFSTLNVMTINNDKWFLSDSNLFFE